MIIFEMTVFVQMDTERSRSAHLDKLDVRSASSISGIKKPCQMAGFSCKHEIKYGWLLYQFRG